MNVFDTPRYHVISPSRISIVFSAPHSIPLLREGEKKVKEPYTDKLARDLATSCGGGYQGWSNEVINSMRGKEQEELSDSFRDPNYLLIEELPHSQWYANVVHLKGKCEVLRCTNFPKTVWIDLHGCRDPQSPDYPADMYIGLGANDPKEQKLQDMRQRLAVCLNAFLRSVGSATIAYMVETSEHHRFQGKLHESTKRFTVSQQAVAAGCDYAVQIEFSLRLRKLFDAQPELVPQLCDALKQAVQDLPAGFAVGAHVMCFTGSPPSRAAATEVEVLSLPVFGMMTRSFEGRRVATGSQSQSLSAVMCDVDSIECVLPLPLPLPPPPPSPGAYADAQAPAPVAAGRRLWDVPARVPSFPFPPPAIAARTAAGRLLEEAQWGHNKTVFDAIKASSIVLNGDECQKRLAEFFRKFNAAAGAGSIPALRLQQSNFASEGDWLNVACKIGVPTGGPNAYFTAEQFNKYICKQVLKMPLSNVLAAAAAAAGSVSTPPPPPSTVSGVLIALMQTWDHYYTKQVDRVLVELKDPVAAAEEEQRNAVDAFIRRGAAISAPSRAAITPMLWPLIYKNKYENKDKGSGKGKAGNVQSEAVPTLTLTPTELSKSIINGEHAHEWDDIYGEYFDFGNKSVVTNDDIWTFAVINAMQVSCPPEVLQRSSSSGNGNAKGGPGLGQGQGRPSMWEFIQQLTRYIADDTRGLFNTVKVNIANSFSLQQP